MRAKTPGTRPPVAQPLEVFPFARLPVQPPAEASKAGFIADFSDAASPDGGRAYLLFLARPAGLRAVPLGDVPLEEAAQSSLDLRLRGRGCAFDFEPQMLTNR